MIEVEGLVHRYGNATAVDGISFSVRQGELVGLLGPNGAGKSTTMRAVCGLLDPTAGQVRVGGYDHRKQALLARRQLGYLPENTPIDNDLSVREFLGFAAAARAVPRGARATEVDRLIEACGLEAVANRRLGECSKGFRQRAGLAQALAGDPSCLVLDEPTSALDPSQLASLRERIVELGRNKAVLLSTHILPEAERLCDRVLILYQGRVVAEGSPRELAAAGADRTIQRLLVSLDGTDPTSLLRNDVAVADFEKLSAPEGLLALRLQLHEGSALPALISRLVGGGVQLLELRAERGELEDAFVGLVRREAK